MCITIFYSLEFHIKVRGVFLPPRINWFCRNYFYEETTPGHTDLYSKSHCYSTSCCSEVRWRGHKDKEISVETNRQQKRRDLQDGADCWQGGAGRVQGSSHELWGGKLYYLLPMLLPLLLLMMSSVMWLSDTLIFFWFLISFFNFKTNNNVWGVSESLYCWSCISRTFSTLSRVDMNWLLPQQILSL